MEVIKKIDVPPTPESAQKALMQQFLIDGFPLFSEIEPPQVIAYYIYLMEQDGVDFSGLNFAEIPLAPADDNYKGPRLRKRRQVTEDIEKETKKLKKEAKKDQKKEEKKKAAALKAYSEPPQKGDPDKSSSDSISKLIDSLLKPPQSTSSETPILLPFSTASETQTIDPPVSVSLTSTQIPIPIPSEPIQTQTTPITSTTFSSQTPEYLDALDREIYITNPVPLNSAPPLKQTQSDSEVTMSDLSPIKSADFKFSDPQSPPTNTLPQTHINPLHTPTSNPISYDFQGPSTPSEEYLSEPASPEATNIQSSSPLPVTNPLSAIVIYQPM